MAAVHTKTRRNRFSSVSSMIDEDDVESKKTDLTAVMEKVDVITTKKTTSFIFGVTDNVKSLCQILSVFQEASIDIAHIESRVARRDSLNYEIFVDVDASKDEVAGLVKSLKERVENIIVQEINSLPSKQQNWQLNDDYDNLECTKSSSQSSSKVVQIISQENSKQENSSENKNRKAMLTRQMTVDKIPWFPRKIQDLDKIARRVIMYGSELDADHPGFKDTEYRKRRDMFTQIAFNYKHGEPIPKIDYSTSEKETWKSVYIELNKLYPKMACREFLENLPLLQKFCGFREDNIPQLDDVSKFLKERSGFILRPVAGYLSPRDFLSALAFRVFNCTQYIRHSADPFYTPEPDCCHELLGHVPLLADKSFAQFSQEIGLASLGAPDEELEKLAKLYFFTVEFGLCFQDGDLRVYGAGLLSCIGELKHVFTEKAIKHDFDLKVIGEQTTQVTTYQDAYFITKSFETLKIKCVNTARQFAGHLICDTIRTHAASKS